MIQLNDLQRICPQSARLKLEIFVEPLNAAMAEFEIDNTPLRICAFLAQCAHESMGFQLTREIWGPTEWQKKYEGREDLGNIHPGDGSKYRGRGLIQLTGRINYYMCGNDLDLPLVDDPELLEEPVNAARSAGWFWKQKGLNAWADKPDFIKITRLINGGTNGLAERQAFYDRALKVIA